MIHSTTRRRSGLSVAIIGVAGALALTLSSCAATPSGTAATSAAPTVAADPALAAMLPASITSAGVLKVAVPDGSAPLSSVDTSGAPVGMDPDLANALGALFGVKVQLTAGSFDAQIPGLQAGRYDLAMGEYYVTAKRLANVDFVTDWQDYSSFASRTADSYAPATAADLCGHPVGVLKGSAEEASVQAYNDASCTTKMTINSFADQASSFLALNSSRIDAVVTGRGPLEAAAAKSKDQFKITGKFGGGPTATAVARTADSAQLLKALQAGFAKLAANGTYAEILKKWNTSYGALDTPTIYTKDSTPPVYS